ncbi:hypothetical protein KI743_10260 [Vibrio sp. D420a]|uniref:hypothetical protein n=1 Tax=Vibrio sp. D420a TaxID=2836895 RepID=UPI002552A51B|nr:hypothetical protein [Vibrio sp. D420a]MDK9762387.1 hypothetical protein [Vibrio sp. D420a]
MKYFILGIMCILSQSVLALDVFNIQSGDLCEDIEGKRWVCHNNVDTYVTGQSRCMFNKQIEPCTWYGFEFDYRSYDKTVPLRCSLTFTYPIQFGNPNNLEGKSDTKKFELFLEENEGRFFNPQYMLLPRYGKALVVEHAIKCTYKDAPVFESFRRFHLPKT